MALRFVLPCMRAPGSAIDASYPVHDNIEGLYAGGLGFGIPGGVLEWWRVRHGRGLGICRREVRNGRGLGMCRSLGMVETWV